MMEMSATKGSPAGGQFAIAIDLDGFDGLTLQRDPSVASWVADYLWQGPRHVSGVHTVRSMVPPIFSAYARIHYPFPSSPKSGNAFQTLLGALAPFTTTPETALFCLWEGYGGLEPCPPDVRKLAVPNRNYYVYRGALAAGIEFTEPPLGAEPEIVCPDDRAWVLGTDTDLDWYFFGGAEEAVSELVHVEELSVRRVQIDDPVAP